MVRAAAPLSYSIFPQHQKNPIMQPEIINPNRRILVIDDNRAIHDDFRKILSPRAADVAGLAEVEAALFGEKNESAPTCEFQIDSAYQGQEGLTRVRQAVEQGQPYAMAFVDVRIDSAYQGQEGLTRVRQAVEQ